MSELVGRGAVELAALVRSGDVSAVEVAQAHLDRISQFEDTELWVKAGMSKQAAENYLGAIRSSLESPNMILDLRVPKSAQYQGVVLDTAVAQFLAGEISRDQAMRQIEQGWDKITDDEGRDEQKAAYADSLNIQR